MAQYFAFFLAGPEFSLVGLARPLALYSIYCWVLRRLVRLWLARLPFFLGDVNEDAIDCTLERTGEQVNFWKLSKRSLFSYLVNLTFWRTIKCLFTKDQQLQ